MKMPKTQAILTLSFIVSGKKMLLEKSIMDEHETNVPGKEQTARIIDSITRARQNNYVTPQKANIPSKKSQTSVSHYGISQHSQHYEGDKK